MELAAQNPNKKLLSLSDGHDFTASGIKMSLGGEGDAEKTARQACGASAGDEGGEGSPFPNYGRAARRGDYLTNPGVGLPR